MRIPARRRMLFSLFVVSAVLCFGWLLLRVTPPALANPTVDPTNVTVAGSFQNKVGCTGDWQPDCANTHLTYDPVDDVWQGTFTVTVGSWAYKAALNDSWTENYGAHAVANGADITFTLPVTTPVKFYYDHKSHWITSNQNAVIAVAPGSFQAKLGCPGDWQPDCLRSWLQDPDGDGIYTFVTTAIPAGSYETKVALNETWDVNYGAGGAQNGTNIPFTVANNGDTVTFSYAAASHLLTVTTSGGDNLAALVQPPARNPIANDVFYFVMPDRFSNGSTANDQGGLTGDRLVTGFDPTDKGFYHGGDLAGLLNKLDYLRGMGVTAIWMTPMFKNNPVQGSGADVSAAYHGYWITDFTQIDPHFGTNAELQAVIDGAHQRGIKVFFDIIANHTADIIQYQENQYSYRDKATFPYKDANGNTFDDRDYVNKPFPTLNVTGSFPYTPIFTKPEDATSKAPAWLNNPIYYHNRGNSTFSGENSLYGDFFGLDDLFTEQPDVVNGMIDIYKGWITNFNIDGFRIDTVKHVNVEFWQKFAPAILDHAKAQGKPNFFIFGEVYSANPQFLSFYTASGANLPAVLDFQFQQQARSYVSQGGAADSLKTLFDNDDYFTDADSNASSLVTFLGNHDMGRFGYFLNLDNNSSLPDAAMLARDKLAHGLLYFARGVPVVYYGDEQGFTGDGGDKDARQDMMPSQVASYNDDKLIGTTATTAQDNFDTSQPLYQSFTNYATIRAAHQALRTGAQIDRVSSNTPGIYAFSRIDRNEKIEYVVAFNNGATATANVPTFYAAGQTFDLVYAEGGSGTASLTTDANGALPVNVPAEGFVIYKATSAIPASAAAPAISFPDLTDGKQVTLGTQTLDGNTVPDRLEIKTSVTGNQYAEVTFAVRATGTTSYTVVGVDDNPPYRVFYNVSQLPVTATLDIIAIVNDLNGHLNAAKVGAIQPVFKTPPTGATYKYAVIHYQRSDYDYGNETTGNFNDFWGLHLWGDAIDPAEVSSAWDQPKPFLGEDSYGRFAWIKLADASKDVNFIVHRGDTKDGTNADRKFNPAADSPEIWLKQGDPNFYTSRAAAQGYVTIHYHRPDGVYTGWGVHLWGDGLGTGVGTTWDAPRPPAGTDDFGIYFTVPISDVTKPVNFIIHNGDTKDPGPDQNMNPTETSDVWIQSGDQTIYKSEGAAEKVAIIHYHRAAGDYGDPTSTDFTNFWGLHVWDGAASPNPSWQEPVKPAGTDKFGIYFKVPLTAAATQLAYIIHRGDTKDPGPDQFLNLDKYGNEVWQLENADPADPYLLPIQKGVVGGGDLSKAQAHWVSQDTIAWNIEPNATYSYQLYYAPTGGLALANGTLTGGSSIALTYDPNGLSDAIKAKFPQLATFKAFKIGEVDMAKVPDILKGQSAIAANVNNGNTMLTVNATSLQIPGVLDTLYTYTGTLGVIYNGTAPTLRLWAPTAKSVKLHLYDTATAATASQVVDMTPGDKGTWSATGDASWTNKYYLYEVEVYAPTTGKVEHNLITDPYSVGLSMNSQRSLLVDLAQVQLPAAAPGCQNRPVLAPEDMVLYELHVRDFSINDATVPTADRGTFKAFTDTNANGMKHLAALQAAGLTHVHLLPAFDFASVDEDKTHWQTPNVPNAAPDSDQQQAAVMATADQDGFNWGYDPYHYGVPEGSYATDPNGATRILEFRQMLAALHCTGLNVVMDVVYNHTTASGQADKSVLDKIVPGYYHRLDADGKVETSTCCQNTATEHAMMEKLMIDTLVRWAKDYGVDGFRFDLMGHHMKANMEKVRNTLHAINPQIYLYGEGWNFGEVANNARGVNATQLNMAGTGIGTFNDRLRDAVRGGGPFDSGDALIANQGFISGLYYDPNAKNTGSQAEKDKLLLYADQIRVGLAGNLADYPLMDRTGVTVTGQMVDYNGSPTGYTQDPQEEIVYAEAHDNQTLFDISQFKNPISTTLADRARVQNLGLDLTLLAQGVPFIHAGEELLRSKSEDGNSYNSGDWFNKLDFTYQTNNWGVGLPPQASNGGNWPVIQPMLANPALKPGPANIQNSFAHIKELLQIRKSSKLFRLETKTDVIQRVHFANTGPSQLPGLIVMRINDKVAGLPDLDPNHDLIVVLFNANDQPQTFTDAALQGAKLTLHPIQANSTDPIAKQATFTAATGAFTIPARTTAVFVDAPTNQATSLTIVKDAQPDSPRNFRFTGSLGNFQLDDPGKDDGDRYHNAQTFTVKPGLFTVKELVPAQWYLTSIACTGAQNASVDLAKQQVVITIAAGNQATCTFTDQYNGAINTIVYDDRNHDGARHREPALKNWRMTLYDANGQVVAQRQTTGAGKANFQGLRPGAYTICEQLQTGWVNSQPNKLFPTFGNQPCYSLQVAPGQAWTVEFGNYKGAAVAASANQASAEPTVVTVTDPANDENYENGSPVDTDENTPFLDETQYLPLIER